MLKLKAHWQILIALVSATLLALLFRRVGESPWVDGAVAVAGYLGGLFMLLLKMIIVPLVVSSVVAGISGLHGVAGFGRLLGKTTGFYAISSFLAICLGLLIVNTIQPGLVNGEPNEQIFEAFQAQEASSGEAEKGKVAGAVARGAEQTGFAQQLGGFFERMIPPNIFTAAADNGQLLGLIFFSILFAVAMTRLPGEQVGALQGVFQGINDTMIVMTRWIMALAPIGVFGLILPVIYEAGGGIFVSLGKYFLTVLLALGLHMFVIMPLLVTLLTRESGWAHLRNMRTALLTAFSTASSSATLPVTMRSVQEEAGVSKRVSSFTLPLGATVNMDGTALYECVAVIFVAQVMGIELAFGAQFMVVLAALLTSVGVAGIPSASLVAIFIILTNSGIPNAEMAVVALLSVDRLLDMTRTAVNVFGDSCAALFVDRSERA
ncbi:MAG: dicarboxylate/amino acid:cation symporter [Verrucomicrobiales bacterium]